MDRKYLQRGITVSGLIYLCIVLGTVAVTAMKLFPLYNEKITVNFALEKIAGQSESARMTKQQIVRAIMRQFEISEVRRWGTKEFTKLLKIEKIKGSKQKVMKLAYEIRKPFFWDLDVVLKYNNSFKLGAAATD